ncbi:MAG TPA: homocysteine S-methyltransferase family protein, partial [Acidimicrobiales bacterium]|nr:homocysteine S-methyltransferase family protein [Acidimicrobiales bacterium]
MTASDVPFGRLDPASSSYLSALRERVVVFDGAAVTNLQPLGLEAEVFGGHQLEGCYEMLALTAPNLVEQLHRSFLDVGVDVIETNTFGAFSVVLAEYQIADRAAEINLAAARLARRVADEYSTPERPIWVGGSMGPGTKFATLGQISYVGLCAAYEEQALGLLEGGVDLLVIETVYDLLGAKAAINGARQAMAMQGRQVPLQVQVTIELTGRMLPGTEIAAALTTLDAMQVDVVGLNCATGPAEMGEALRYLSANSTMPISCQPNAGLPSVVDGAMHYDLSPDELAEHHHRFITEFGVRAVGGCCGTTPAHLSAVVERCAKATPAERSPEPEPAAASIYSAMPFHQDTSFLVVGERANANGSRQFREAMLAADWDTCVAIARDQVKEGSHVIDVCVDYTGADGVAD